MCKFDSADDAMYQQVENNMHRLIQGAAESRRQPPCNADVPPSWSASTQTANFSSVRGNDNLTSQAGRQNHSDTEGNLNETRQIGHGNISKVYGHGNKTSQMSSYADVTFDFLKAFFGQ